MGQNNEAQTPPAPLESLPERSAPSGPSDRTSVSSEPLEKQSASSEPSADSCISPTAAARPPDDALGERSSQLSAIDELSGLSSAPPQLQASSDGKDRQTSAQSSKTVTKARSEKTKNIFNASALALSAFTASFFFLRSGEDALPVVRPLEKRCTSAVCDLMVKVLHKPSNQTDICEDFFAAVCSDEDVGGAKQLPGDNITEEISRLANIEEAIFLEKLINFAMPERRPPNLTGTILDSEMQMGKFFLSCFHRDDSVDDARKFFLEFLDDLGIPMEFSGDKQYFSMFSALVRLSLVWGINNPLLFIELKAFRDTKNYVTVIRTLKKNFDINGIDVNIMRRRRAKESNPNTEELREKLRTLVHEATDRFGGEGTKSSQLKGLADIVRSVFTNKSAIEEKHLLEMVLNHEAVSEFLSWRLSLLNQEDDAVPLMAYFNTLEEITGFPWRKAISFGVRDHLNLSLHSKVVIDRPDVSFEIVQLLLDARFHRVFRHYLYVWLLRKLRLAMGKQAETEACATAAEGCSYLNEDKERYCFRKVREYFPRSFQALVSRSLVTIQSRAEVKLIMSVLLLQSARMIKKASFMQDGAKLKALRLIATTVVYEGSPEYLNEMRSVEYNFEVGRNFFQNLMMVRRDRFEERLVTFERTFYVSGERWPHLPISQPEAYYDVDLNTLTVPATLMTFPHHLPNVPLWISLAGLGWHVVHKMFHVFDSVNRKSTFALYRRDSSWDEETTRNFENASECFRRTYRDIASFYPKRMSYVDEAAIDNAAVYVLSQSFEFLDKELGRGILPTSAGYDYPDIYWIAAVKPFCYTTYVYTDKKRSHMFSRARINYALRNLKKFPRGFKCGAKSPSRKGNCQAWVKT